MKTRYTSLVSLKKNNVQSSERVVQNANLDLKNANSALEDAYNSLQSIDAPQSGNMKEMLASRALIESGRDLIKHNQGWVEFANKQLLQAKEQLRTDMIEHEKFKYLELEEIKKIIKKKKLEEAKEMDEIALMTYSRKST